MSAFFFFKSVFVQHTKLNCLSSVFSVTVVSDEGSPITDINPVDFSMLLWKGESPTPPKTVFRYRKMERFYTAFKKRVLKLSVVLFSHLPQVTTLKCSKPVVNGKNDCYYFR